MAISTLQTLNTSFPNKNKSNLMLFIFLGVLIIFVFLLILFSKPLVKKLQSINGKSAIVVDVSSSRAEILINDQSVGNTPFESQDIKPGNNKITIKSLARVYETTIKFLSNNDKYIHKVGILRDLGISDLFSSGQDLWFDEDTSGTVLRIISEPVGASVFIDNTEIGKAPFTSSKLSEGDYDLRVESVGYETQKARIRVQKGYTSNVSVKLFPMPVPSRVSLFKDSTNLFDLSSDNNQIASDTATWTKAIVYWNQTRGVNIEGVGLNKELVFDYFLDFNGNLFDNLGDVVNSDEKLAELKNSQKGAYLGRISDGAGLTENAKVTLKNILGANSEPGKNDKKAKVLETGTGWLRVRNDPSINGTEVAKVDVGKEYTLIEEQTEWVKIVVSDSIQGWVSKRYIQIVEPQTSTEAPTETGMTKTSTDTTNIPAGSEPATKTVLP